MNSSGWDRQIPLDTGDEFRLMSPATTQEQHVNLS